MNVFTLTGNTTKDAVVRTSNGTDYARITVANTHTFWNGERRVEEPFYIPVTAFGPLARSLRSLGKGSRVEVVGRIKNSEFDREDGSRVFRLEVIAEDINFVSFKKAESHEDDDSSGETEG